MDCVYTNNVKGSTLSYITCSKRLDLWILPWQHKQSQVYKVFFHMKTFGGLRSKRTMLLTNNPAFCRLERVQGGPSRPLESTCERYVDKNGRVSFKGTDKLKKSQLFSLANGLFWGLAIVFSISCKLV